VGRPERKSSIGRPRRRWQENIKIDLQEVGRGKGLELFRSEVGQVAGYCECGNEHSDKT
jgi:hypothetical protein